VSSPSGSAIGGAAGAGLGTAAATLLTGGSVEDAAKSGAGSAAGTYVGTAVGGPVGGIIGGMIGGAVGGGSVICTELHRQGLINDGQLRSDTIYGREYLSLQTMRGYWLWGKPYARLMAGKGKRSKIATKVALYVFNLRYKHVEHVRTGGEYNKTAHMVSAFGEGLCFLIGGFLPNCSITQAINKGYTK
jgi:hypothetical protein